ncbi:aspartate 4-decarboxylase [Clostridium cylindrosporum]|uniref:Aminotransferase n=1 Tax=Clostridium cylindrosporum DSM 605 TaxID=1121307 RepID=A0A0J8D9R0_CLOCY|nr:aspartate 4-decarboxylase [Clostridium cylindrosporum]KMT21049.1 bifunctional aspartate aminotransferase and L-aspartate beta-decarboxylase [Clostridium cylindrosporum DSM 605]
MANYTAKRKELEELYNKISPFELKNKIIAIAESNKNDSAKFLLNAGRGNPNWIADTPRDAFFTFGHFATEECRRVWNENDLAGMPSKDGIAKRLYEYITNHPNAPGIDLLKKIIDYGINVEGFNPDEWVYEIADGIIGDNYPLPDRMLIHTEKIVNRYILQEMYGNKNLNEKLNIFAVEGATAAMCYIFDSLVANSLILKGEKIAIMSPIFTPYLEIPLLSRYDFEIIEIKATETTKDGTHTWQYPSSEIEKLKDPSIKALFIVNPSNPPSVAIRESSIQEIVNIVENHNPNLIIISDDVYCTFVDNFKSILSYLPHNTIGVYSFSKYFGVTGWRLGVISLKEDNVIDKTLKSLPQNFKDEIIERYESITTNIDELKFIDRLVADSRQVALNHTAGLSTPQQVQMAFFCGFSLVDKENNYKNLTKEICRRRQRLLFENLGLELRKDPLDASYYTEFDLLEWANHYYGSEFTKYLQANYTPVDVLYRLAEESSIILLSGGGFHGPEWSIRISLANLNDEDYIKISKELHRILQDYINSWKSYKDGKK